MTSFVFRAVAGVVNGAACAVNHLLEVMYPKDVGHIWDELAAPCADPHPAGAADPAAETVTPDLSAAGSPLTWRGWAQPAVLDVLNEHLLTTNTGSGWPLACAECHTAFVDIGEYYDHLAPLICDRIACDPTRAALALTSLQTQ